MRRLNRLHFCYMYYIGGGISHIIYIVILLDILYLEGTCLGADSGLGVLHDGLPGGGYCI